MVDLSVQVAPADGGWAVHCSALGQPLMFLSGRKAEQQARRLADCLASLGQRVSLVIRDRTGGAISVLNYGPGPVGEAA